MNENPDFAAFWAVFPRKDRKIEARFEFSRAARRFGADRVILTAARYCAASRGLPRDAVLSGTEWLRGLIEPEQPQQARAQGFAALDPAEVGSVLLGTAMISWQLGHQTVAGTIRDYLAPHGPHDGEREFVYRVLLGVSPRDLITEDEARTWLQALDLPGVAAS